MTNKCTRCYGTRKFLKTLLEVEGKKLEKVRDFLVEGMTKQEVSIVRMPCTLPCIPGEGVGRWVGIVGGGELPQVEAQFRQRHSGREAAWSVKRLQTFQNKLKKMTENRAGELAPAQSFLLGSSEYHVKDLSLHPVSQNKLLPDYKWREVVRLVFKIYLSGGGIWRMNLRCTGWKETHKTSGSSLGEE